MYFNLYNNKQEWAIVEDSTNPLLRRLNSVSVKTRNSWSNLSNWAILIKAKLSSSQKCKPTVKNHSYVCKKYNGSFPHKVRSVKDLFSTKRSHRQLICAVVALWRTALAVRSTYRQVRYCPGGSWCDSRGPLIATMHDCQMSGMKVCEDMTWRWTMNAAYSRFLPVLSAWPFWTAASKPKFPFTCLNKLLLNYQLWPF